MITDSHNRTNPSNGATAERGLFPPIDPYDSGFLDTGEGHTLYWELCGNPAGIPAVLLHGGLGAGCCPAMRRWFDPTRYCVLLFDQRGCGRSSPLGSLERNTTWHSVEDIERLRAVTGTSRWAVFGGSWGTLLALAYAQTYPARVSGMILRGVFTARRAEIDWLFRGGASWLLPDAWEHFVSPIPIDEQSNLLHAYHRRLTGSDATVRQDAALSWSIWVGSTVTIRPDMAIRSTFDEEEFAAVFARASARYFVHGAWMEEGQLIDNLYRIAGIPALIVQGRFDVATPIKTAWELHRAWPGSELHIVSGSGHAPSADEPALLDATLNAVDRLAGILAR
jgi:proline iminopeptidase